MANFIIRIIMRCFHFNLTGMKYAYFHEIIWIGGKWKWLWITYYYVGIFVAFIIGLCILYGTYLFSTFSDIFYWILSILKSLYRLVGQRPTHSYSIFRFTAILANLNHRTRTRPTISTSVCPWCLLPDYRYAIWITLRLYNDNLQIIFLPSQCLVLSLLDFFTIIFKGMGKYKFLF